jgi:hypothetical protein
MYGTDILHEYSIKVTKHFLDLLVEILSFPSFLIFY